MEVKEEGIKRFLRVKEVKEVILPKAFSDGKKIAMHFSLSIDGEHLLFASHGIDDKIEKDDFMDEAVRVFKSLLMYDFGVTLAYNKHLKDAKGE